MASEGGDGRKVLPNPDIPLTPGQIVKLGGLFVLMRERRTIDGREEDVYYLPVTMWIDPCEEKYYYISEQPWFHKIFNYIGFKGGYNIVTVKPEWKDKVVYVNAVPSVWVRGIEGGLFWRPVPYTFYMEVLKADGEIDKEFLKCMELRRRRRREEKEGRITVSLSESSIEELVTKLSDVLSREFERAGKGAIRKEINKKESRDTGGNPEGREGIINSIISSLIDESYVYNVVRIGNVIDVYTSTDRIGEVIGKLRNVCKNLKSKIINENVSVVVCEV